jgi:hypothetical protein
MYEASFWVLCPLEMTGIKPTSEMSIKGINRLIPVLLQHLSVRSGPPPHSIPFDIQSAASSSHELLCSCPDNRG